jgi:hypothetical protein
VHRFGRKETLVTYFTKTCLALLLLVSLSMQIPSACKAAEPWHKINEQDEIEVYRRQSADSNIYEFRGTGAVQASIPKIIALLTDTALMPEWIYACTRAETIEKNYTYDSFDKQVNEYYKIIHVENELPWPIRNRDYVFKSHLDYFPPQKAERETVVVESINIATDAVPPRKNVVRVPLMHSQIKLVNHNGPGQKKTVVDFTIQIDPGGVIPTWLVNLVSKRIPHKTIMSLRALARLDEYDKRIEALIDYHVNRLSVDSP